MSCTACGHENRAGRKFCVQCGATLTLACAACSAPYEAGEKFCGECGAPLGAPVARPSPAAVADAGARKVVTIVFADLVGSTALHERLDAESARRVMERYYDTLGAAVGAHGGTVVKLLGDGVMAAFGLRQVTEDDALRAVRAAFAMQEAFRALAREEVAALGEVGLRVAVNTGEVVVSGAQDDVIGDPVNVAARLQEQGGDGDVVLGEATRRLVATRVTLAPLGSVALKGRAEAVAAYRLVSLDPPAGATATPFVGRDDELARLGSAYAVAVATPTTRLAVLLGSPGLGKSRLIDEFARRHADAATILAAHCDAAGGTTFAPLAQAVRAFLGLDDAATGEPARAAIAAALSGVTDDGERSRVVAGVAALLGGAPTSPEETFFVVRRFLAGLAAANPVVLVIDDLHWAEPLLLDLVEHLVQWGGGVPLFVLVGARPELHDLRSSLVTPGGLVADVVTLSGLDAGAAMRLAANVIGAADLPAAVAAKVLATSEGNPLFVGELVRMLVQEGALTKHGERWIVGAGLAALEMPPTIHALLAARIERLRPEERGVLERAAVVGRHFSRSAVAALMPRDDGDLDARLESLRRSELIERDAGWLLGEPALRFHHVLIRDAAYRRLLKGTRAELHARLADWIEARVGDAPEHDETIGWHLEQAHRHLRELGPLDAAATALGERASQRLAAAGRRALAGDDVPLAAGLLGRAIECLGADDAARADLALDWCEALLAAGDVGPATAAIAELGKFIDTPSKRLRAWHTCFTGQLTVLTAPQELQATADAVAAAAVEFAALGDAAGEAKAHQVHAQALARLGRMGACEAALDRALAAARRAGDRRRANAVLAGAPLAALWGPSPVTRASGRCLDVVRVLRITQGAPAVEAVALSCQGVLEALRGRTDAARRMIASSRKMVEELGITHRLLEADAFAGRIDLLEGDAIAAERSLRGAYEGLRDLGLGIDAARAAALLARALLAQGKAAEAEALSRESEALAGDDLQAAIAWRGVRAEALAERGEHATAVELAQAAVTIAAATDALLDHADARLALAAALRAAGRRGEADTEKRRATELWEAKGATLLAERVRREEGRESSPRATEARVAPERSVQRRVRPNAATASAAQFDAAFASGDAAAIEAAFVHSAGVRVVDHPTESTYGHEGAVDSFRRLLRLKEPVVRHEPLATLGDSLGLFRRHIASGGTTGGRFDVADYQRDEFVVVEPGVVIEIFAADRLDDAVACLYARSAELLPDEAEHRRAALTARSVAALSATDPERLATALSPSYRCVDHRVLHTWSARSATEAVGRFRVQLELAPDFTARWDDVVALAPQALLVRSTYFGTDRAGGGGFENRLCMVTAYGADGLVTCCDVFEAESTTEALARFDELVRSDESVAPATHPRVRPNAASRLAARFEDAFAAADDAALADLFASSLEVVNHPNGASYGRDGHLASVRRLRRSRDPMLRFVPIATLGERLSLLRRRIAASGTAGARFDVGESESEEIVLFEVGEGRCRHIEVFAADRLGDAIACLYAHYAELLQDGAARGRATATAGAIAAMVAPPDLDRYAAALAPSVEFKDHRTVGFSAGRGATKLLRGFRSLLELAADVATRVDDVVRLEADAILLRWTTSGTDRRSGGAFESPFLLLWVFGSDGLVVQDETFDAEREVEAVARFDELARSGESAAPVPLRRVRANEATAFWARFDAAFAARDADAIDAGFSDAFAETDHTTGASYGRDGALMSIRRLLRSPDPGFLHEALATLGPSLGLFRGAISASGTGGGRFDVGAYEIEEIKVTEVDEQRRLRSAEVSPPVRLGDAIARVYERYADLLPDNPARDRAAATARTVAALLGPFDLERFATGVTPDITVTDHRRVGLEPTHGAEAWLSGLRALLDLASDVTTRVDDVLALRPDALLVCWINSGTDRRSGGPYERHFLWLGVFGADGLNARLELFEPDHEADALARFDALGGGEGAPPTVASGASLFANAATRFNERFTSAWAARDWDTVAALHTSALKIDDRRRLLRMESAADLSMAQLRVLFDVPGSRWVVTPIATRGERLALSRVTFEGEVEGGGGDLAIDYLMVDEVDADGRSLGIVSFDLDDLDAGYAELDRRYDTGDGAEHAAHGVVIRAFTRAVASRDWEPVMALCAPAFVEYDHRALAVLGTTHGAAAWAQNFSTLTDLAPDTVYRVDHFRSAARGFCSVGTWDGSREGGRYEIALIAVIEMDEQDRMVRADIYDPDRLDAARTRFAELTAPVAPPERFANAATATVRPVIARMLAHDWQGFAALFSEDFRISDRRRVVQLELDRDGYVAFTREVADGRTIRARSRVLATRGERLALTRGDYEFADADVGPSEIAFLLVTEVDDRGRTVAYVRFDLEDLDAAYAELDARWAAGEVAAHPLASRWIDQAQARFAEIATRGALADSSSERFPNAATRTVDRGTAALAARDWEGFAGLMAPGFRHYDRTRIAQIETDGREWLASFRQIVEMTSSRPEQRLLATRGDRLALFRMLWRGAEGDIGPSEIDWILVVEVDDRGDHLAVVAFDPEDFDAAYTELDARWTAGEAMAQPLPSTWLADYLRAFAARDWTAMAALLAPDLLGENHRLVGWGTLHGPAAIVSTVRAQIELAPDTQERVDHVRTSENAVLFEYAWHGTREGGAFENVWLVLVELDAEGRARRVDVWEPEQIEQARARFDALCTSAPPDPVAAIAKPNAATATMDRWQVFDAGLDADWDALRASCAPGMIFEDRQGFARLSGGRELMIASLRERVASGARAERRLVGTAGERVAVTRMLWSGGPSDGRFEIEYLSVVEVDEAGLVAAIILFGADDERAAQREAWARWAAIDPAAGAVMAPLRELIEAYNARDRGRWHAQLASDGFVIEDHRRTGFGRLDGADEYADSIVALWELAPDATAEADWHWPAFDRHGAIAVLRRRGTLPNGGGDFESEYLYLALVARGRITRVEMFELDDLDAALARFEALRPGPTMKGDRA